MLFNELKEIEKSGARERALIRRQCEEEIIEIRRKKDEAIEKIDRQHIETMAAIEADYEKKKDIMRAQQDELNKALEKAQKTKDFSKVCEIIQKIAESIA
jgi:hypothetical protein